MVALEVWYNQMPGNDFGEGDSAIIVNTVDELAALIDRVRSESDVVDGGAAIQVAIAGDEDSPVLEVGLGRMKGFITYHSEDGGQTLGDGDPAQIVEYTYMGQVTEMSAAVEVSINEVRAGLLEFFETGGKPAIVR
ncbi:MAG: Imm1 family immunity protein [Actinomycetota bacterium]|nr:Imm1 family immunity protein [Actinomycetota bacterium]